MGNTTNIQNASNVLWTAPVLYDVKIGSFHHPQGDRFMKHPAQNRGTAANPWLSDAMEKWETNAINASLNKAHTSTVLLPYSSQKPHPIFTGDPNSELVKPALHDH